ncbi:cation:dicarboxylase symporter family transporter [Desulfobulbus sp. AH-315-M07]|nr:cation:dicarboxylase symporter family transporter [Desulfobulbus sp. AH-315-M07]
MPLITVGCFLLGIVVARGLSFTHGLIAALDAISEGYVYVAPVVIFLILAPSLLKLARERGPAGTRFTLYSILWFAKVRILGLLFSVAFAAVVFGLPMHGAAEGGSVASVAASGKHVLRMMLVSPYFWAVYASIATCLLLRRSEHPYAIRFARVPELIENFGKHLSYVIPMFMFLMGIYICTLPSALQEHFGETSTQMEGLTVLGYQMQTSSGEGLFAVYAVLAVLTGIGATVWHGMLLVYARRVVPTFRVVHYLRNCFARVYPLLWATSSEALATPVVLHLMRKHYPDLHAPVRRFCAGLGSFVNINGTLLCVFIMTPAVAHLTGVPVGWVDLLMAVPAVFVLGYGVPGIPGELVLFAGPMMAMVGVPVDAQATFLLVYLGLQIGLPDSFRTGGNSTDVFPATLILHQRYVERYAPKDEAGKRAEGSGDDYEELKEAA